MQLKLYLKNRQDRRRYFPANPKSVELANKLNMEELMKTKNDETRIAFMLTKQIFEEDHTG